MGLCRDKGREGWDSAWAWMLDAGVSAGVRGVIQGRRQRARESRFPARLAALWWWRAPWHTSYGTPRELQSLSSTSVHSFTFLYLFNLSSQCYFLVSCNIMLQSPVFLFTSCVFKGIYHNLVLFVSSSRFL